MQCFYCRSTSHWGDPGSGCRRFKLSRPDPRLIETVCRSRRFGLLRVLERGDVLVSDMVFGENLCEGAVGFDQRQTAIELIGQVGIICLLF